MVGIFSKNKLLILAFILKNKFVFFLLSPIILIKHSDAPRRRNNGIVKQLAEIAEMHRSLGMFRYKCLSTTLNPLQGHRVRRGGSRGTVPTSQFNTINLLCKLFILELNLVSCFVFLILISILGEAANRVLAKKVGIETLKIDMRKNEYYWIYFLLCLHTYKISADFGISLL